MPEQNQEPQTSQTSSTTPFNWRGGLIFFLVFCCVYLAISTGIAWWSDQEVRPLFIAGQMIWMATVMGLSLRRKQKKENDPTFRWYRFSLAELFVIATGFAFFAGFIGADDDQQRAVARQREQLQTTASEVLGPDGQLGFESNGSLTIGICDRTFDDKRLIELSKLIHDYVDSHSISRVLFGTGSNTAGTAPRWPGITDLSVELMLQWPEINMLSIDGTGISTDGRMRLLMLQELGEQSKKNLRRE